MEPSRIIQKKRTSNFREDETKLLIQLWGSPQVQNKLFLTHRKAPVMRILAANMQQRGFYRTPDEIKTRIRNLKCLYHRIKRSMSSGSGVGTIDPDWPHYKAMDEILTRQSAKKDNIYDENVLEGPRCEDIKQEIEDIEFNEDVESYSTNSMGESEFEEETPMPVLTPAPNVKKEVGKDPVDAGIKKMDPKISLLPQNQKPPQKLLPAIYPNNLAGNQFTLPMQNQQANGMKSGLPFPLLILNGVQSQLQQTAQDKRGGMPGNGITTGVPLCNLSNNNNNNNKPNELNNLLKELIDVQKEHLNIEKERLELEKQKMEFQRVVGTQLLTLVPIFGSILQRIAYNKEENEENSNIKNGKKRKRESEADILKDNKMLKNILENGIKKFMLGEEDANSSEDENEDSTNNGK